MCSHLYNLFSFSEWQDTILEDWTGDREQKVFAQHMPNILAHNISQHHCAFFLQRHKGPEQLGEWALQTGQWAFEPRVKSVKLHKNRTNWQWELCHLCCSLITLVSVDLTDWMHHLQYQLPSIGDADVGTEMNWIRIEGLVWAWCEAHIGLFWLPDTSFNWEPSIADRPGLLEARTC